MINFLRWLITIPLIVFCLYFAFLNTQDIEFYALPTMDGITTSLYLLSFLWFTGGFLFGVVLLWLSHSTLRKERRQYKKTVKKLEKQLTEINNHFPAQNESIDHDPLPKPLLRD